MSYVRRVVMVGPVAMKFRGKQQPTYGDIGALSSGVSQATMMGGSEEWTRKFHGGEGKPATWRRPLRVGSFGQQRRWFR